MIIGVITDIHNAYSLLYIREDGSVYIQEFRNKSNFLFKRKFDQRKLRYEIHKIYVSIDRSKKGNYN